MITIYNYRRIKNNLALAVLFFLTVLALIPLGIILIHVIKSGYQTISFEFLTQLPVSIGEPGGGIAHALVGSLKMLLIASLFAIPIGILSGAYLSEYSNGKWPTVFRFVVNLMTGIPSIVIGLFVYAIIVVPMKGFSAIAGSLALALLMLPIIIKSTEEILKLIPQSTREAGLALGLPRHKVILRIILKGSFPGLTTGVLLAVARVSGETAPLLLTAFGNSFWSESLKQPSASLTVQIYNYATSPFQEWHKQAWACALILLFFVLGINLSARFILKMTKKVSK